MLFYLAEADSLDAGFGNPSSIHWAGRKAKLALDEAREKIAIGLGIESEEEIVFTGSGTEATNAALQGAFFHATGEGRAFHLITSKVEHEATLETAKFLEGRGAHVTRVSVDGSGQLKLEELEQALATAQQDKGARILISMMAANNETGVLFPVLEVARLAERYAADFHLDAIQAPGKVMPHFKLSETGANMASISAHKFGGPKGVGCLYLKRSAKLVSFIHGGAQERKRRAGTHNVAGIVGFGEAVASLASEQATALGELRDRLEKGAKERIPNVLVIGESSQRLTNTSNLLFRGVRGDSLLMSLDLEGIAVSTGSACSSGTVNPSHVLLAMGFPKDEATSAIRVSLGPANTRGEVDRFLEVLPQVVKRIRGQ